MRLSCKQTSCKHAGGIFYRLRIIKFSGLPFKEIFSETISLNCFSRCKQYYRLIINNMFVYPQNTLRKAYQRFGSKNNLVHIGYKLYT